jgi:hypothetical protein
MGRLLILPLLLFTVYSAVTGSSSAIAMGPSQRIGRDPHHTTYKHTRTVVASFIHAYNNHDLRIVMSLFVPTARYSDCDWVHQTLRIAVGYIDVQRLMQREFADNQRIMRPIITTANPHQRYVAGQRLEHRVP